MISFSSFFLYDLRLLIFLIHREKKFFGLFSDGVMKTFQIICQANSGGPGTVGDALSDFIFLDIAMCNRFRHLDQAEILIGNSEILVNFGSFLNWNFQTTKQLGQHFSHTKEEQRKTSLRVEFKILRMIQTWRTLWCRVRGEGEKEGDKMNENNWRDSRGTALIPDAFLVLSPEGWHLYLFLMFVSYSFSFILHFLFFVKLTWVGSCYLKTEET